MYDEESMTITRDMQMGSKTRWRMRRWVIAMVVSALGVVACHKRSQEPPLQAIQIKRAGPISTSADYDISTRPIQHVVMVSVDGLAVRFDPRGLRRRHAGVRHRSSGRAAR